MFENFKAIYEPGEKYLGMMGSDHTRLIKRPNEAFVPVGARINGEYAGIKGKVFVL